MLMSTSDELKQQLDQFRSDFGRLRSEIAKVIVGQQEILAAMRQRIATVELGNVRRDRHAGNRTSSNCRSLL